MLLCYLMIFLLICIIKYNINGKNNHYRNIWEVRTELCKILIKNTFKSGVSKQLKETKKIGVIPQQQEGCNYNSSGKHEVGEVQENQG